MKVTDFHFYSLAPLFFVLLDKFSVSSLAWFLLGELTPKTLAVNVFVVIGGVALVSLDQGLHS